MINVRGASLTTLAELIQTGQHSSVEVTEAYLARIDKYNPALNAYLKVFDRVLFPFSPTWRGDR